MGNNGIKQFAKKIRRVVLFILAIIAILATMAVVMLIAVLIISNEYSKPTKNYFDRCIEWEYFWEKDKNGECVIDLADFMDFEWDSLKYYSRNCNLEYIEQDLGCHLENYISSSCRIVFMKDGKVVKHIGWHTFPSYMDPGGVVFYTKKESFTAYPDNAKFKAFKFKGEEYKNLDIYIYLEKIE